MAMNENEFCEKKIGIKQVFSWTLSSVLTKN